MTRAVLRDAPLQRQFDSDGYVAVPMLSAEEVVALRAALARLDPADGWHPDGSGPAQNSYHCSFLDQDTGYKRQAFDLLADAFKDVIDRHLVDYRALSANFYVKPHGQGRIPVHQNWPVLDSLSATSVTVWCPLVDVAAANGALHVVPGSHKLLPHVEGPGSLSYFSDFRDDLDDLLVALSVAAGDGIIFDDSLVHGSPDNMQPDPRIAVQITCIPREADPVFHFRGDDGDFELVAADCDFYVQNDVVDLVARRPDWPAGRRVPNRNRQLTKREFAALLGRGPVPAPIPVADDTGWLKRAWRRLISPS